MESFTHNNGGSVRRQGESEYSGKGPQALKMRAPEQFQLTAGTGEPQNGLALKPLTHKLKLPIIHHSSKGTSCCPARSKIYGSGLGGRHSWVRFRSESMVRARRSCVNFPFFHAFRAARAPRFPILFSP
jgi:hypothetical protein